jgi:FkbM family methyltransferase
MLRRSLQRLFNRFGISITRYKSEHEDPILSWLRLYQVDAIFDVGAHRGQSGRFFRRIGFDGQIVSFEPVGAFFRDLEERAGADPLWHVENIALGDEDIEVDINVAGGRGGASSILEMRRDMCAPHPRVVRKERISVRTLGAMIDRYYPAGNRLFLKLDVQGYEAKVLAGAGDALDRVVGMKIEMSLVENYYGEMLYADMIAYLAKLGYRPVSIRDGWRDHRTKELYQVDGVFFRTDRISLDENAKT